MYFTVIQATVIVAGVAGGAAAVWWLINTIRGK